MSEKIALFRGKTEILTKLFSHKLLAALIETVDTSKMKETNWKKLQIYLEIVIAMTSLQAKAKEELGEEIEMDLKVPDTFCKLATAMDALKDGTNFTSQMNTIKFQTLIEAGDDQIKHLAHSYKTVDKRFETSIDMQVMPLEKEWNLKISKVTGPDFIQVQTEDGQLMVDKLGLASGGLSKMLIKAGQKVEVSYPVKPSVVTWVGMLKSRHQNQEEFSKNLASFGLLMDTAAISPT